MNIAGMMLDSHGSPFAAPSSHEEWRSVHSICFKTFQQTIGKKFARDGEVSARWFLLSIGDGRIVTHTIAPVNMTKDESVFAVKTIARIHKVFALYFCTEAWFVRTAPLKPGEPDFTKAASQKLVDDVYKKYDTLEDHPERIEAVLLSQETAIPCVQPPQIMTLAEIVRPAKGKPNLKPWESMPEAMVFSGRFTHLLHDASRDSSAVTA